MIRHVLANGKIIEDITGITIPVTGAATITYAVIAGIIARKNKNPSSKSEKHKDEY